MNADTLSTTPHNAPEPATRAVPVEDSALLGARAIQLLRRLNAWTASLGSQDSGFAPQVAEMAALSLASAAPHSSPDALLPAAMNVVWAQTVDDRFDLAAPDLATVDRLISRCRAVARGTDPDPANPVERALADVLLRLRSAPLADALLPVWRDRLDRMMDSCRFEWLAAHDKATLPTLDTYLTHHHSVGFGTICAAWWTTTATPDLLPHLDTLLDATDHLECAIRLANDQRTAPREHTLEGAGVNALTLGATPTWIRHHTDAALDSGHTLLRPLHPCLPQATELSRVADWLVRLYRITEARITPT